MTIRPENFIAFFAVSGFFCGIVFSVLKTMTPADMLMYTLFITLVFYLLAHVILINFLDIKKAGKELFNREEYEDISAYFIHELQDREALMEQLVDPDAKHEPDVIVNFMERDGVPKKNKAA